MNTLKSLAAVALLVAFPASAFADSTIVVTSDANTSVSPSGIVTVPTGNTQVFNIAPAGGYQIANVSLDGTPVGAVSTVSFMGINLDPTIHTLDASSVQQSEAAMGGSGTMPFCSGPLAPGWNVSLPGGGCGGTARTIPAGTGDCPFWFVGGCIEQ